MMQHNPALLPAWQKLAAMPPSFDETPRQYQAAGLTLDLTTAGFNDAAQSELFALAEACHWQKKRDDLLSGTVVNSSENRPALHTALRAIPGKIPAAVQGDVEAIRGAILGAMARIQTLGAVDIIHVGLGGSGLGPLFLRSFFQGFAGSEYRLHIIINADPTTLRRVQNQCDPQKTIVIIASKTFRTEETMLVAEYLKKWLGDMRRMFAITGKPELAKQFGIATDHMIPMPDWLGGRFSLWGGVALPIFLTFGTELFAQLVAGARAMDEHFVAAPREENLPLLFALAHIWQRNFMHCGARAIIPYADALRHLTPYVQQLEMESNGKIAAVSTAPVIFGGVGTTVQHSFMQQLHQGADITATDLIVADELPGEPSLNEFLRRSALAQSAALAHGAPPEFPGGRPSNMIFLPGLTPYTLGALIALYEHKIFLQSCIWDINCFDQPGVELGKDLARQIAADIIPRSTAARLGRYK